MLSGGAQGKKKGQKGTIKAEKLIFFAFIVPFCPFFFPLFISPS
jgi:hypothetical protein